MQTDNWGRPGTWEILSFPRKHPGWRYRVINSRLARRHSTARERNRECKRGTAERRKRSDAGRAAGSHSVLIVLLNLGNGALSDPAEGSETPNHGTVFEKHIECIEIRKLCPRNRDG